MWFDDDITICGFTKQSDFVLSWGFKLFEKDVNILELNNILKMVERRGVGKLIHKPAYDGVDSNGHMVYYDCYYFYLEPRNSIYRKCFKYNFDPEIIPLNSSLKNRWRVDKINSILNI